MILQLLFRIPSKVFQRQLKIDNKRLHNILLPIIGCIFVAFSPLDYILAPQKFFLFFLIRVCFLLYCLLLHYITKKSPYKYIYVTNVILLLSMATILAIFSRLYPQQQHLIVRSYILAMIAVSCIAYWPTIYTIANLTCMISIYVLERSFSNNPDWTYVVVDTLFLANTLIFSGLCNLILLSSKWQNYISNKKLQLSNYEVKKSNENKTQLLMRVSHELQTPINIIISYIDSLISKTKEKIKSEKAIAYQQVQSNSHHLAYLINNLLTITLFNTSEIKLNRKKVDIVKLIQGYIPKILPRLKQQGVRINFEHPQNTVYLYIDLNAFQDIFFKLLKITINASPKNQTVLIKVQENNKSNINISFHDQGEGIPKEILPQIFNYFQYENPLIPSLDLHIVESYCLLHNYTVSVKSKHIKQFSKNHGTIFTIHAHKAPQLLKPDKMMYEDDYIPSTNFLFQSEYEGQQQFFTLVKMANTRHLETNVNNQLKSILIIEKNIEMLQYLYHQLHKDYIIYTATNSLEGIQIAKKNQPNLIIIENMMPRLNGYQIGNRIRMAENISDTPILLLTTKVDAKYIKQFFQLGSVDFINKPISTIELLLRVESLMYFKTLIDINKTVDKEKFIRKQLEVTHQELQELYHSREQFFSSLSHEIRTPLSVMMMITERLIQEKSPDGTITAYLEDMYTLYNHILRIGSIVTNILYLAKFKKNKFQMSQKHISVNEYFNNLVEENMYITKIKKIGLAYKSHVKDTTNFYIDQNLFTIAVMNLLHNALKYTKEQGEITITSRQIGAQLQIRFSDTGIGIKQDLISRIFEEFTGNRKKQSTEETNNMIQDTLFSSIGLGLQTTQTIIIQHKGTITVESKSYSKFLKESGTTFIIDLPTTKKTPQATVKKQFKTNQNLLEKEISQHKKQKHQIDSRTAKQWTILIVEDELVMLSVLKKAFTRSNFNVITASNGSEGLKQAKKFRPDIVLTDLIMPKLQNSTMVHILRGNKLFEKIPIVVLSGKEEIDEDIIQMTQAHFSKPVTTSKVISTIHTILTTNTDNT